MELAFKISAVSQIPCKLIVMPRFTFYKPDNYTRQSGSSIEKCTFLMKRDLHCH